MTAFSARIPRGRFLPLPASETTTGAARRVGVEIEFAGLLESEVADLVAASFGGTARAVAPYEMRIEGTSLGTLAVYLDTAFRRGKPNMMGDYGLKLGREVIPVEIVTEPLSEAALPRVERLREILRAAGAVGSGGGWLFGFGLHFNIEVADSRVPSLRSVLTAFALMEDWLRLSPPIDPARRLLPFVDPYPRRFVRRLLDLPDEAGLAELLDLYLQATPTRNRALDLLPLIRNLDAPRFEASLPRAEAVGARPAWHYRLPDSRIDEPDWSIAFEWNRWVLVERVAADSDLLHQLAEDWHALDDAGRLERASWCEAVDRTLAGAGALGTEP